MFRHKNKYECIKIQFSFVANLSIFGHLVRKLTLIQWPFIIHQIILTRFSGELFIEKGWLGDVKEL